MIRQRIQPGLCRSLAAIRGLAGALMPALLFAAAPAQAQQSVLIDKALQGAGQTFEQALPQLPAVTLGLRVADFADALKQQRFASQFWGKTLDVQLVTNDSAAGLCAGFAAYVLPQIDQGTVSLVVCPRFFTPGADSLRETTILHEMVHVVAGPDECRAMAFTARLQMLARGSFVPVADYWARNKCDASRYRLPD